MSLTKVLALFPKGEKDENGNWTWETKVSFAQRMLIHGNARRACEELEVPMTTYQSWRKSDWFLELLEELKIQQKLELNNKMSTMVDKALTILEDRLDNGDFILNNKTGEIQRKQIPARDAARIATEILGKKLVMDKMDTDVKIQQDSVSDTLKTLAKEFAKFNNKLSKSNAETIDYVEVTDAVHDQREARLQKGSGEIYEPSGSS